jgi:hypothetical protein
VTAMKNLPNDDVHGDTHAGSECPDARTGSS